MVPDRNGLTNQEWHRSGCRKARCTLKMSTTGTRGTLAIVIAFVAGVVLVVLGGVEGQPDLSKIGAISLLLGVVFVAAPAFNLVSVKFFGLEVTFQDVKKVVESVSAAVEDRVSLLPGISVPGLEISGRTGQEIARYDFIDDPRLKFLSFRFELEERLGRLAAAANEAGLTKVFPFDPPAQLVRNLEQAGVITPDVANSTRELLKLGDRVARGAQISTNIFEQDRDDRLGFLMYALGHLATELEFKARS
jgi:hypothetical protein